MRGGWRVALLLAHGSGSEHVLRIGRGARTILYERCGRGAEESELLGCETLLLFSRQASE